MRVAAVDCGTNSLRLLVADVDPSAGSLTDVDRRLELVRLGQGVDATGRLAPEALARTLRVLRAYAAIIISTLYRLDRSVRQPGSSDVETETSRENSFGDCQLIVLWLRNINSVQQR